MREFKTTEEVHVPTSIVEQVIGQDNAVEIIKKAAKQRRNVLLLGSPGTGKSMLAQAMAELMPAEDLSDVLSYANPNDENKPRIRVVKTFPTKEEIKHDPELRSIAEQDTLMQRMRLQQPQPQEAVSRAYGFQTDVPPSEYGTGRKIIERTKSAFRMPAQREISPVIIFLFIAIGLVILFYATGSLKAEDRWFVLAAVLGAFLLIMLWRFTATIGKRMGMTSEVAEAKLIVDNSGKHNAPFVDATGSKAGALLGDVKHDPLQSGGLGTPAHLRVESGAIHRANKGVLFIDEMANLKARWQQALLTAMQDKKYTITGQSEMSSGAMVKTEPVPCDFVLVAAGNAVDLRAMHPALRSRIRGNGYEVYVEETMPDNPVNEDKLVQFVAQEVRKDGKIPHFTRDAVLEILDEARRRAGRKKKLSLNLRELGGVVRVAGDIARDQKASHVDREHVLRALGYAQTMEEQISKHVIDQRKDYKVFLSEGNAVGKVNGLAVLGDGRSGLVLPIVAEVTPASSKNEGKLIATGKLGKIAQEAVENVSAIIKKHTGKDVSQYDFHVQFLQTYEGVEGDSASISIALAVISAMEEIPVMQECAMTGSLSVRGEVLPVGGVTGKVQAAIDAGMKRVLVPKANYDDIYLPEKMRAKIKVIPVSNIVEVLEHALVDSAARKKLIREMRGMSKK